MRIISDYDLSRSIVASRTFGAWQMADGYRGMSARLGHDFGPAIALLEQLPTFMDGEAHNAMRKAMARKAALYKPLQLDAARAFLATFAADRLRPGEQVDLMQDLARPLFRAMSRVAMTAMELPELALDVIDDVPLLFSPFTPLKKRLEINARLGALTARHGEGIICDLALMVLGVRPMTGGLAMSLHATVSDHPGSRLSAMPWPAQLTVSAVRYVDRMCLEATTLAGESFAAGEHLRCRIHVPAWTAEQRQTMMFGVGSHLCLGRPISELVWTLATGLFAGQDVRASAGALDMKQGSDPFDLPAHCPISLDA